MVGRGNGIFQVLQQEIFGTPVDALIDLVDREDSEPPVGFHEKRFSKKVVSWPPETREEAGKAASGVSVSSWGAFASSRRCRVSPR
jgi:hypothetical protein